MNPNPIHYIYGVIYTYYLDTETKDITRKEKLKEYCLIPPIQHFTGGSAQCNKEKNKWKKRDQGHTDSKERSKTLFTYDMILYV